MTLDYDTLHHLHKQSSYHKAKLLAGNGCGCFHCLAKFGTSEITEWIDGGDTALCPRCGVDAVLGDATDDVLREMEKYWFSYS